MEQTNISLREKALGYTEETFREHKEQAFWAIDIVREIVSRWGLEEPRELIEQWEKEKGEAVPLKEILLYGLKMIDDGKDPNSWEKEMYKQAISNGYTGYEWYITLVYLTGMENIDAGTFSNYYQFLYRTMVPEQWQKDYDSYRRAEKEDEKAKERAEIERIVGGKFQEAALIKASFHRRFKGMDPEGLRQVLKEMNYKNLACGIYQAEESLRNRFLGHMAPRQRELVMKEWCRRFDNYCTEDTLEAMSQMMAVAGLI